MLAQTEYKDGLARLTCGTKRVSGFLDECEFPTFTTKSWRHRYEKNQSGYRGNLVQQSLNWTRASFSSNFERKFMLDTGQQLEFTRSRLAFLRRGHTTDIFQVGTNLSSFDEKFMIIDIIPIHSLSHCLRYLVGISSSSQDLVGSDAIISQTSFWVTG